MQFTKREREKINELLEESREVQRKNGNRLYTDEEVWGEILGENYYKEISYQIS